MLEQDINESFLLLLVEKEGVIDTSKIAINNHFESEKIELNRLCDSSNDNINEIINFINNSLKPKIDNEEFNYCKKLDKPYQSVKVNIKASTENILAKKNLIIANEKFFGGSRNRYTLEIEFIELKKQIKEEVELWFKVYNIDCAYETAKKVSNMLVYSHRISGWSNPEYQITKNLKQQIKTNFGYGSVSYFYSLLTFKNIQITPLSEWIDYHKSDFSEVIRYTKSFRSRTPVFDSYNRIRFYKTEIENSYWQYAIEFTKNTANLSLINEQEFVEKYIIRECEIMVNGLEMFYNENEFDFIDENQINVEKEEITRKRIDIKGYELIDFRTEKIIGALDFIIKINEYDSIIPTIEYTQRIISLNKKFIPNVYSSLQNQNTELKTAINNHNSFILSHNQLLKMQGFYENEKSRLKNEFYTKYEKVYNEFLEKMNKSIEELNHHKHKINLHKHNVEKLKMYINKYHEIVKE